MAKKTAPKLRIIPLGGLGEIGKNMTVFEYGDDIIVVDCGLAFPDEDMLGIDIVIPDMSYLELCSEKLRAFIITHGHEDHIGAIPYAMDKFQVPVYGTKFTLALVDHKLHEKGINNADLRCIAAGREAQKQRQQKKQRRQLPFHIHSPCHRFIILTQIARLRNCRPARSVLE